jgi:ribose transport system permease protein
VNFIIAFLAALCWGPSWEFLNGISGWPKVGTPSFLSTYGLQGALFGFAYVILKGYVLYDFNADFRFIGNGLFAGVVPMPFVVMLLVVALGWFILRKRPWDGCLRYRGELKLLAQMVGD